MYSQYSISESRPTMILYGIDNIRDLFGPKVPVLYCCDETFPVNEPNPCFVLSRLISTSSRATHYAGWDCSD